MSRMTLSWSASQKQNFSSASHSGTSKQALQWLVHSGWAIAASRLMQTGPSRYCVFVQISQRESTRAQQWRAEQPQSRMISNTVVQKQVMLLYYKNQNIALRNSRFLRQMRCRMLLKRAVSSRKPPLTKSSSMQPSSFSPTNSTPQLLAALQRSLLHSSPFSTELYFLEAQSTSSKISYSPMVLPARQLYLALLLRHRSTASPHSSTPRLLTGNPSLQITSPAWQAAIEPTRSRLSLMTMLSFWKSGLPTQSSCLNSRSFSHSGSRPLSYTSQNSCALSSDIIGFCLPRTTEVLPWPSV